MDDFHELKKRYHDYEKENRLYGMTDREALEVPAIKHS